MTAVDLYAEMTVAACAAASNHGAALAHERVDAGDFTSGSFRAVFEAAADLQEAPTPTAVEASEWARAHLAGELPESIWPSELRLAEIARRVDTPLDAIERLVARRPVFADQSGSYARRLRAASRRRRIADDVLSLHELVNNVDVDDDRATELAESIASHLAEAR